MENLISKVTTLLDSNVQFSAKNKKYHKIYKKKKKRKYGPIKGKIKIYRNYPWKRLNWSTRQKCYKHGLKGFPGSTTDKEFWRPPPSMRETWVQSLSWEDPLEEGMATHSSILAWKSPMDRGAWWATVPRVTNSQTRLNN